MLVKTGAMFGRFVIHLKLVIVGNVHSVQHFTSSNLVYGIGAKRSAANACEMHKKVRKYQYIKKDYYRKRI